MGRDKRDGFTLIEIMIVVSLIALALTLTLPRFLPMIMYGALEGDARHLGAFGRLTMEHCALMHENFTIKVDLDNQEYWAVRKVFVRDEEAEQEEETEDELRAKKFLSEGGETDYGKVIAKVREGASMKEAWGALGADEALGLDYEAEKMRERFWDFQRLSIQAQAKNVKQEGILSDIGPLFEDEFSLDDDEEELEEQEVFTSGIERTRITDDVFIEKVRVGGTEYVSGIAEIEITSLGLIEPVSFYVKAEEEYFTVAWDPVTRAALVREGRDTELFGREYDDSNEGGS